MEITIRPMRSLERHYFFSQSERITAKTACIGYLRADFGSNGTGFWSTWNDKDADRKTDAFKAEFNDVINALRSDKKFGSPLKSRGDMVNFCSGHSECILERGRSCNTYGFRANTGRYSYMLRMNPSRGEYNLYCYCYERHWLDRHLQGAERGIRFVDRDFNERFRIPDGESIRIFQADGTHKDMPCRYIDEYNVEIGWFGDECCHILEFAQHMEQSGSTVIPLRSTLPQQCYGVIPSTGEVVVINKGERNYTPTGIDKGSAEANEALVHEYNKKAKLLPEQAAAMLAGVLHGWDKPEANPINYDADGKYKKPKSKEEMER